MIRRNNAQPSTPPVNRPPGGDGASAMPSRLRPAGGDTAAAAPAVEWLGVGRVATLLKKHPSTVYRWIDDGYRGELLQHIRIGKSIYTTQAWLDDWLQRTNINGAAVDIIRQPEAEFTQRAEAAGTRLDAMLNPKKRKPGAGKRGPRA